MGLSVLTYGLSSHGGMSLTAGEMKLLAFHDSSNSTNMAEAFKHSLMRICRAKCQVMLYTGCSMHTKLTDKQPNNAVICMHQCDHCRGFLAQALAAKCLCLLYSDSCEHGFTLQHCTKHKL